MHPVGSYCTDVTMDGQQNIKSIILLILASDILCRV